MQIELLNEQGQSSAKVDAPDTLFGRDYNEALVHYRKVLVTKDALGILQEMFA